MFNCINGLGSFKQVSPPFSSCDMNTGIYEQSLHDPNAGKISTGQISSLAQQEFHFPVEKC